MPYLSDIGRETADKAERLFTFINSRFLHEVEHSVAARARPSEVGAGGDGTGDGPAFQAVKRHRAA